MAKQNVEKYIDTEIQSGRTKQEIFNHIVSTSSFNFHDVANIIRKTPTLEKRKKYKLPNLILTSILCFVVIGKIFFYLDLLYELDPVTYISLLITFILLYSVYTFKRNMHLITGVYMLISFAWAIVALVMNFELFFLVDIVIALLGAVLAFYLSIKLTGDYVLNKELQASNPEQRENIVTFTE